MSSRGELHARIIDEVVTLKALDRAVFHDDKEGVLGLRVAGWLESPDEKGGEFTDASGKPTKVQAGVRRRERRVSDQRRRERRSGMGNARALVFLDGPHGRAYGDDRHSRSSGNPGYPTYWHARGYGLFAANPLGRSIFDPKQPAFNFTLEKDQAATFRYRVMLVSRETSAEELNREADAFAAESK